jgi:hypothetical protein
MHLTRYLFVAAFAVGPTLLTAGCGPSTGTITGAVTVDGKPVEKGVISFIPADSTKAQPITVDITAGKYSAQTQTGPKIVQISAPVVTGRRPEYNGPGAPLIDITEESIPAQYNSDSTLKLDITPGANTKDWALEGVKRK